MRIHTTTQEFIRYIAGQDGITQWATITPGSVTTITIADEKAARALFDIFHFGEFHQPAEIVGTFEVTTTEVRHAA